MCAPVSVPAAVARSPQIRAYCVTWDMDAVEEERRELRIWAGSATVRDGKARMCRMRSELSDKATELRIKAEACQRLPIRKPGKVCDRPITAAGAELNKAHLRIDAGRCVV